MAPPELKMANLVQESLDKYHLRIHSISCISCRKHQSFCLVNHWTPTIQLESTEIHWTATQFSMLNEPPTHQISGKCSGYQCKPMEKPSKDGLPIYD
jgi:hypothetical protein